MIYHLIHRQYFFFLNFGFIESILKFKPKFKRQEYLKTRDQHPPP